MFLPKKVLEQKLLRILSEDLGQGDVTSAATVSRNISAEAWIRTKEPGTIAGLEEGRILLESLGLKVRQEISDGQRVKENQTILEISGDAQTILSVERTVLNIISHMSGIATKTSAMIDKLRRAKLKTKIACTRKTTPGLLYFDKKAVMLGGGDTHRLHLDDMILIKDNHISIAGKIEETVEKARKQASFSKKIEVEVTTSKDALTAASMGVDVIMLDNFSAGQVTRAVQSIRKAGYDKVILEASGGIASENLMSFAAAGVDIVSLGELTSHVKGLDVNLEFRPVIENQKEARHVRIGQARLRRRG